jgi:hypothetical protein
VSGAAARRAVEERSRAPAAAAAINAISSLPDEATTSTELL